MKKLRFLSALLIITISASSQSTEDIQDILHLCFEHAEMNAEEHLNDAGIPVLVITGEDVLPDNLILNWFGEPVLQLSMEEIEAQNIQAFLVFEAINFNTPGANVNFLYYSSQPVNDLSFRFQQVNGIWSKIE